MSVLVEERLSALEQLWLDSGAHTSFEQGACIMEAVAYVAGEPFSDHPKCASPVLGAFLRSWNDALSGEDRQMLKPYITRLVGTATGKADDERRAWLAVDWLVHEYTPAMLRLAGLTTEAETLEALVSLTSKDVYREVRPTLVATRDAARERRDEAWKAAEVAEAAWAAAAGAAWTAGAAGAAEAAGAAWTAEVAGAAAAAGAAWTAGAAGAAEAAEAAVAAWAAWAAVAVEVAEVAAKKAKDEGGDYHAQRQAARDAALPMIHKAVAPTLKGLQASALLLLDRMIEVDQPKPRKRAVKPAKETGA